MSGSIALAIILGATIIALPFIKIAQEIEKIVPSLKEYFEKHP